MGLLDKFKNIFIEELDDETEIKKEVFQVKIPKPEENKVNTIEKNSNTITDEEVMTKVEKKLSKDTEKIEEPVKTIPTYFDDDDFKMVDNYKEKSSPAVIKQEYKYTKTETTVSPTLSGYGIKRDEPRKKSFTPTPIISPVYGVLDKNYRKDEIKSKNTVRPNYSDDKVNVDDIRKKAYGTLEDELENELSGSIENEKMIQKTPLFDDFLKEYDDKIEKEPIDIFGEIEKKDALDDYIMGFGREDSSLIEDELNKDYDKYEEELNKSKTKEYSDDDLFNLIDSMYRKKDGE